MKQFKFMGQQREAIWVQYPISVTADSYAEAIVKLKQAVIDCQGLCNIHAESTDIAVDIFSGETVYEGEFVYPEANYGYPTIRIRDEDGMCELPITNIKERAEV